jgi:hypothetical protein
MTASTPAATPPAGKKAKRKQRWDAFLDAYSAYLHEPSVTRAAALHLAGVALEEVERGFSLADFERRLGWNEALT